MTHQVNLELLKYVFSSRRNYEKNKRTFHTPPPTPPPLNKDDHFYRHQVKDSDSTQQPLAKEQWVLSGHKVQDGVPSEDSIIVLK